MSTFRSILAVLFVAVCIIALVLITPSYTLCQTLPLQIALVKHGWWIPAAIAWYLLTCAIGLIMVRLCVDATRAICGPNLGKRN